MRSLIIMAALIAAPTGARSADLQTEHTFEARVAKTVSYRYLRSLPAGYPSAPERGWPLLLFLHGAGERGADLRRLVKHGPPKLLAGGPNLTAAEAAAAAVLAEQFIVISPQCPTGQVWDDDAVLALLDAVGAGLRVDRARIYITGLSMGGYGTWSVAMKHPERFAAAVPICGGGLLIDILLRRGDERGPRALPGIWAFHGAKDPTVPLAESERMVAALERAGAKDVTLTVYPEARHDSWTEAYANPELYAWLLRHTRTNAGTPSP